MKNPLHLHTHGWTLIRIQFGYTNLPARNDTLFSERWGPKRSLISTTAGRSNTVTHISGWALVSSWAKAPVHPGKTNTTAWKRTAQCTRRFIYAKAGSCSPPRSQAVVKRERSKAVAIAFPVTFAILCMALMNLSLMSWLLYKVSLKNKNNCIKRSSKACFSHFSLAICVTWNRSFPFLPKALSCWWVPSLTAHSRCENRGHTVWSQCRM